MGSPGGVPVVDMTQLDAEHRSLNPFHAIVVAKHVVMVLATLSVIAEELNARGIIGIVCDDGASLSVCAQILAGIKAEAREVTDASSIAALICGPVRLRSVFNNSQTVTPGDLH